MQYHKPTPKMEAISRRYVMYQVSYIICSTTLTLRTLKHRPIFVARLLLGEERAMIYK